MRLIDAEALLDKIPKEWTIMDVGRVVTAPTVDAVPVVRCKDCAFLEKLKYGYTCDFHDNDDVELDDYCSRGLRNDGKDTK